MKPQSGSSRTLRTIANVAGLMLLVAAVYVVYRNRAELSDAWRAAQGAPAWYLPVILALPLLNWVLTSAIFWTLTARRHGRVGPWEMAALIGSAWLLNMLPFKPGFMGRLAYHRAISGIPIRTSLVVTLIALLTGGVGVLVAVAAQIAGDESLRAAVPVDRLFPIGAFIVVVGLVPGIVLWVKRAEIGDGGGVLIGTHLRDVFIAVCLRVIETHIWAFRYWLAFELIGQEEPYGVCVVVAGVSQIAGQVPIQLGLREWAVGVSTGLIGSGRVGGAVAVTGITVDILCRACEIACAIPVGVVSYAWIRRRLVAAEAAGAKLPPRSGRMNE